MSTPAFKDHFSQTAAVYAAHRPTYPRELVDLLAEVSPRTEVAWDSGCGSGQLSVLLADRFDLVIATDASQQQIDNATQHPKVEYRCEPAEASTLEPASVDLAVVAQSAHWYDLEKYYDEVRRVARPGAALALVTYGVFALDEDISKTVDVFYYETLKGHWPPDRRHVEAGYKTFDFPFEELEWPKMEIVVNWRLADLIGYFNSWSGTRNLEKAQGREPIDSFYATLAGVWGDPNQERRIAWPLSLRLGRV